jgi:hypothetical protein
VSKHCTSKRTLSYNCRLAVVSCNASIGGVVIVIVSSILACGVSATSYSRAISIASEHSCFHDT